MTTRTLGTSCLGYELPWVRVVLGTSWCELSWVRVVLGTSCFGYELSIIRNNYMQSWYRIGYQVWLCIVIELKGLHLAHRQSSWKGFLCMVYKMWRIYASCSMLTIDPLVWLLFRDNPVCESNVVTKQVVQLLHFPILNSEENICITTTY